MIIYVDILFFINLLMDITILWITGVLFRERIKVTKLILGSLLGAISYIAVLYMPYINRTIQVTVMLLSMSMSLLMTYNIKTFISFIKRLSVMISVSFILSGFISTMMFMGTAWNISISDIYKEFSYLILITVSLLSYIIIKLFGKYIINGVIKSKEYADIILYLNDKTAEVRSLIDTGNALKDNMNGNEIIIAEYKAVKHIFPKDMVFSSDSVEAFRFLSETEYKTRIRLIPFKSLGNSNGLLLGIKLDKIEIFGDMNLTKNNIVMGIYGENLDPEGKFNAIAGMDILL